MINVLVTIEVKDFNSLTAFETEAVKIMSSYNARMITAFETQRNDDGTGQEVHLLEFPDELSFSNYRSDRRFNTLTDLREKAINSIEVISSRVLKLY